MEQNNQILKEKMLKDYKNSVGECLYYTNLSSFKEQEMNRIKKKYEINFIDNYENFINQFLKFNFEDLEEMLGILNIEAESEWTNANRCEASALILGEYFKKLNG